MCFHSKQSKAAQIVENRFDAKIEEIEIFESTKHVNEFLHRKTPVILEENSKSIEHISWRLIPYWAKS